MKWTTKRLTQQPLLDICWCWLCFVCCRLLLHEGKLQRGKQWVVIGLANVIGAIQLAKTTAFCCRVQHSPELVEPEMEQLGAEVWLGTNCPNILSRLKVHTLSASCVDGEEYTVVDEISHRRLGFSPPPPDWRPCSQHIVSFIDSRTRQCNPAKTWASDRAAGPTPPLGPDSSPGLLRFRDGSASID